MSERWIVIPNWDKFQHYSDRDPVWIKVYTELNSRDEWRQLSYAQRGLLVIAMDRIRAGRRTVAGLRCGFQMRATASATSHLESLNDAGWIEFRLLASR